MNVVDEQCIRMIAPHLAISSVQRNHGDSLDSAQEVYDRSERSIYGSRMHYAWLRRTGVPCAAMQETLVSDGVPR